MSFTKKQKIIFYAVITVGLVGMLFMELGSATASNTAHAAWFYKTFSRFFGSAVCCALMIYFSEKHLFKGNCDRGFWRFLCVLPCFAVAVNNFPFLSVIMDDIEISASLEHIFFYAVFCLSVGLFEELAFRGCVFVSVLGRGKPNKWNVFFSIVISSAIFGLVHVVNLFAGASPISVILQIGYSFLIGALCSVVLAKTANIWYCVILHAVYNFAGGVAPQFGEGKIWTAETVAITTIVAVIVTVYTVIVWYRLTEKEIYYLINGKYITRSDTDVNVQLPEEEC